MIHTMPSLMLAALERLPWSPVIEVRPSRFECVGVFDDDSGEDDAAKQKARYHLPKAFLKARQALTPRDRVALDELIERYRRAADGREVAITVRQLAETGGMTRMAASRAIEVLASKGFVVVVDRGSYAVKRKPSRYRLTMFPCRGREPTHDYIEDVKAWRRQRSPKMFTPAPKSVKLTASVPIGQVYDAVEALKPFVADLAHSPK